MTHPRLATLLFITLLASLISLGMPWLSVASAGRIWLPVTATVAIIAFIAVFATTVLAVVVHRTRGLWVILAAVPALFWPAVAIIIIAACTMYDCD
jgi:hypothetical protein